MGWGADGVGRAQCADAQQEATLCGALKGVFGPRGVQHFVMDGVVHDLASYTRNYLKDLAPNFELELHMQQVPRCMPPTPQHASRVLWPALCTACHAG